MVCVCVHACCVLLLFVAMLHYYAILYSIFYCSLQDKSLGKHVLGTKKILIVTDSNTPKLRHILLSALKYMPTHRASSLYRATSLNGGEEKKTRGL